MGTKRVYLDRDDYYLLYTTDDPTARYGCRELPTGMVRALDNAHKKLATAEQAIIDYLKVNKGVDISG